MRTTGCYIYFSKSPDLAKRPTDVGQVSNGRWPNVQCPTIVGQLSNGSWSTVQQSLAKRHKISGDEVRSSLELHSLPQFYYLSPLGAVEKRTDGIRTGWRRF